MKQQCGLCRAPGAQRRDGRLGRYSVTCDRCEAARGSHLDERAARPRKHVVVDASLSRRTGLANQQPTTV
jgi:hypothetical protein